MITNRNPSEWNTEWLDALQAWAQRALGCVGRYSVTLRNDIRQVHSGQARTTIREVRVSCPRRARPGLLIDAGKDPRLPELFSWVEAQHRRGFRPRNAVELLIFVVGHELWHCEDDTRLAPPSKRSDPVGFTAMEQRCSDAGFRLIGMWRAGGREHVRQRVLVAHRARRSERVRNAAALRAVSGRVTGGSTTRLADIYRRLRASEEQ